MNENEAKKAPPSLFDEESIDVAPHRSRRSGVWMLMILVLAILLGSGAVIIWQVLQDPLRTLPAFEVERYLEEPLAMRGGRYAARMSVEADLGWEAGKGRLLAMRPLDGGQEIAVLIPSEAAGERDFRRGQRFDMEVTVAGDTIVRAEKLKQR